LIIIVTIIIIIINKRIEMTKIFSYRK